MTSKFYGFKVLCYLRTTRLESQWKKFLCQPPAEQSLLEGSILISQWIYMYNHYIPSLNYSQDLINDIVSSVKSEMATAAAGDQPTPKETLSFINRVLFTDMNFRSRRQGSAIEHLINMVSDV